MQTVNVSVSITKLYTKFMIPFIVLMFILMYGAIYILDNSLYKQTKRNYLDKILHFCVHEVEGSFNTFFDIGRNYNILFNNYNIINNDNRRHFYNALTEDFIRKNAGIHNIWVAFEENKFDELDNQYKNTEQYPENGSYCIYHSKRTTKHGRQTIIESKSNTNKNLAIQQQKYIQLLKIEKLPLIILNDSIKDDIYFTFCFPIFDGKQNVVGVSGIDIDINNIVQRIDDVKIKLMKEFILISKNATFIYYDNIKDLVGQSIVRSKRMDYKNYSFEYIIDAITNNQVLHLDNIIDKIDNKLSSVHYIPIKVRDKYSVNAYIGFLFDDKSDILNDYQFRNNVLFYFIVAMALFIILCVLIATIIQDALKNKMIAALDKNKDGALKSMMV